MLIIVTVAFLLSPDLSCPLPTIRCFVLINESFSSVFSICYFLILYLLAETENIISIPSCFGIPTNTPVSVQVISQVTDAKDILIEPVSVEDWELLEVYAEWLEGGGLLQQVCVVFPDQTVPLYLSQNDVAHVRILPSNFHRSSSFDDLKSIWPTEEIQVVGNANNLPCLRLVANTQVVVIPKPRIKVNSNNCSPHLRLLPSQDDYKGDVDMIYRIARQLNLKVKAPLVLPHTAVVHPNTLSKMKSLKVDTHEKMPFVRIMLSNSSWDLGFDSNHKNNSSAIATLSVSSEVPENSICKFEILYYRFTLMSIILVRYLFNDDHTMLILSTVC
jgi:Peroxisome biogenesis factor 1, N-terminal